MPTSAEKKAAPAQAGSLKAEDKELLAYQQALGTVQEPLPGQPTPPPLAPRDFTIQDLKAQLPAHLFKRYTWKALWYVAVDLFWVALLGYGATWIDQLPMWAQFIAWPVYWAAQGCVMTGLWVLAHEAGHQGSSDYRIVNDAIGTLLHSALLVPYHQWARSHGLHHRNTCSIEHDEVFVPAEGLESWGEAVSESPIAAIFGILRMLIFGWPAYLCCNVTGPRKYRDAAVNDHFRPWSVLLRDRDYWRAVVSDIFLALAVGVVFYCGWVFGVEAVVRFYLIPYLVVNAHLVLITYLQHTDTFVPHFRESAFTFERGALATVDRSFGWFLDGVFHHINDSHVVHHLFSTMPWYHAVEATPLVKDILGDLYLEDPTPIPLALYRAWARCKYVEAKGDVVFLQGFGEKGALGK